MGVVYGCLQVFGSRVCMGESALILALQALQVYLRACAATSCWISPSAGAAVPTVGKAGPPERLSAEWDCHDY